MGRATAFGLVCLTLFLVLFPLTLGKPGLPSGLKADEPAYYLMALSLGHDLDLRLGLEDVERLFREFPFRKADNVIVMTNDGWQTILYGKPYIYSLVAAPLARFFGANGILACNLLLLCAMIWMGTIYLARYNPGPRAALFSAGFFLLSNGFAYAFWLHPEIFSMASVTACLFFALHRFGAEPAAEAPPPPWQMALSAGLLAPAVYNKPVFALVGAPILVLLARRRWWRPLAAWLGGAVAAMALIVGLAVALTGHPTSYLGVQRRGVSICEPGKLPLSPEPPAAVSGVDPSTLTTGGQPGGTGGAWSWIFALPRVPASLVGESLGYFLWGRHTGLFVYAPFALLALGLFVAYGRRSLERWLLLAALAGVALFFLLWIPANYQGGGGFVGNRYFVCVLPGFLFLATRLGPRGLTAAGYALGSLFLGPIVFTPFGAGGPEPTLQSHVRNAPFRWLPLELSLREVPGYVRVPVGERTFQGRRDQVLPQGERLWVRGADAAELQVWGPSPLAEAVFAVRNVAPGNRLVLSFGGDRQVLDFGGVGEDGETRRLSFHPKEAGVLRWVGANQFYVQTLTVGSEIGRVRPWTRLMPPDPCTYFAFNPSYQESFLLGADLAYLGSGTGMEGDVYALRWGEVRPPATMVAGETFHLPVRLFNQSALPWVAAGVARVKLAYHWRQLDGRVVEWDGLRTELPLPVAPGARVAVQQEVRAPSRPGRYRLELDPVFEQVAWFSERNGGNVFSAEVEVLPATAAPPIVPPTAPPEAAARPEPSEP